jgi:hypothetical protein
MIAFFIILIVVIVLLLKVIKNVFLVGLYIFLILLIVGGAAGYFVAKDAAEFRAGMLEKNTTFFFMQSGHLITGVRMDSINLTKISSLGSSRVSEYDSYYQKSEFQEILGDDFKIIIIDAKAFPKNQKLDPNQVIEYLKKEKIDSEMFGLAVPSLDPKAAAFSMLIVASMTKDPLYLIKEYKKGNVIVYPETLLFKIVKFTIKEDNSTKEDTK